MSVRQHVSRSLPPQPTTFVGRDAELAELHGLLADPSCRLVTLVGPGGTGKTRLAIEVAAHLEASFAHGVVFVPLQAVSKAEDIPAAIATAAGFPLAGQDEPRVQLLQRIQDRHQLLVLDNFEQLVDGAQLLSDLLAAAPALKLLATSRQTLNLQEEWRYPVAGLPVPEANAQNPESYDAVRLFVERGRRGRLDLSLTDERDGIVRICQLVEGMPLAIELAAAWTETLSCVAIAEEIEHDLSVLTTRYRNVPERHRSLRAVFDHSWRLLAIEEQAVFRQLAVFRGGFRREAAESVAGATLPVLAALSENSLVRHEADERYYLHELLRQFGWEQLQSDANELAAVRDRHSHYYLALLAAQVEGLTGGKQREVIATIGSDLENFRSAWDWAVEQADAEMIWPAVICMACFFQLRGRYREGLDMLEAAIRAMREAKPSLAVERTLAAMLLSAGYLKIRIGRHLEAREAFSESRDMFRELSIRFPPGLGSDPEIGLGIVALVDADYSTAARFGELVRRRSEEQQHPYNLPYAWFLLTQAAIAEERYEAAEHAAQEAAAAARRAGDDWFLAYILNDLGTVAAATGDYTRAREHFQASYAIRESFDDPGGMAVTLVHLGRIALDQGEYAEARSLYERARKLYEQSGDLGGIAATLQGFGRVAAATGKSAVARAHFAQALQIASETHYVPLTLAIQEDLERLAGHFNVGPYAFEVTTSSEIESAGAKPHASALPDPLTEREIDVLRLIASGHSNQLIADELYLAVSTVKWHTGQIFGKLQVRNRTQAVARARELGLLS